MEEQQVLDPQRLEQQHHVGQVGPLDLWDGGGEHLVLVGALGVEPGHRHKPVGVMGKATTFSTGKIQRDLFKDA